MTPGEVIATLGLPAESLVDRRVPKTMLMQYGAPTAADKRRINDGIEELRWVAALKPNTIGVPAYRDGEREYLEIVVLQVLLRSDARSERITELIHRAIPYPVLLLAVDGRLLTVSLAHKRWSQSEAGATVLNNDVVAAAVNPDQRGMSQEFIHALSLSRQPRSGMFALYQGWIDTLLALQAAVITGSFIPAVSAPAAAERRAALDECARLDAEIARLRAAAKKEKQMSKRVELNLALKRVEAERLVATGKL